MGQQVRSTINLHFGRIRVLEQAAIAALEQTAEYLHTEVVQAQVVPRMDGGLQGENFFVDRTESRNGKVTLVHATAYARRMYYHPEYNFHMGPWTEDIEYKDGSVSHLSHDGNPNAQGHWFKDWLPGGAKENDCAETYKKFYKKITRL